MLVFSSFWLEMFCIVFSANFQYKAMENIDTVIYLRIVVLGRIVCLSECEGMETSSLAV